MIKYLKTPYIKKQIMFYQLYPPVKADALMDLKHVWKKIFLKKGGREGASEGRTNIWLQVLLLNWERVFFALCDITKGSLYLTF